MFELNSIFCISFAPACRRGGEDAKKAVLPHPFYLTTGSLSRSPDHLKKNHGEGEIANPWMNVIGCSVTRTAMTNQSRPDAKIPIMRTSTMNRTLFSAIKSALSNWLDDWFYLDESDLDFQIKMFPSRKNSRRLPSRTTENRSILPVPLQKQLIIFFKKMKTNKQKKKLNARHGKKTEIWYFLPASGVKHISISRHKHEIPASLLHISNIVQPLIVRLLDQHRDRSELIFLESLAEKWECKKGAVAM